MGLIKESPEELAKIPDYIPPPILVAVLPESFDNSPGLPPVLSQGEQDCCVAWAVGYYCKTYQEGQERGWDLTVASHQFSPAFLYNHNNDGEDNGSSASEVMKFLSEQGCATLEDMPYDVDDYTTWPEPSIYKTALQYRALSYSKIYNEEVNLNDTDIENMKQLLAGGEIFVLSVPVYPGFHDLNSTDYIYNAPAEGESEEGSHAVAVVGYDNTIGGSGALKIVNSWGDDWGDEGFAWLTYDFIKNYCERAFVMADRIGYTPVAYARVSLDQAYCGSLNGRISAIDNNNNTGEFQFFRKYGGDRSSFDWYVDVSDLSDFLPPDNNHKFIFRIEDEEEDSYSPTLNDFSIEYGSNTYNTTQSGFTGQDYGISQITVEGSSVPLSPLGGYLTGNIPSAHSPYLAFIPVYVSSDDTLYIQPGTTIQFAADTCKLVTFGGLEALGTESDSIHFFSASTNPAPGDWKYIYNKSGYSSLKYCDIRHAEWGFYFNQTNYSNSITDCTISECVNDCIRLDASTADIVGNSLTNSGWGIIAKNSSNALIENNTVSECGNECIRLEESMADIIGNLLTTSTYGIKALTSSNGTCKNNLILNHSYHGIRVENSTVLIENNTIAYNIQHDNGAGIWLDNATNPTIKNNIIVNNDIGIYNSESSNITIDYNDVWDNTWSGGTDYYGLDAGTNDISIDPEFVDSAAGDYHLSLGSPCIDAGDPSSDYSNEPMPNGGRINLGAFGNTAEAALSEAQPEITLSATSVSIGDVTVGSSSTGSFTITNEGTANLTVSSISSDNALFTLTPGSATIVAGQSQEVIVAFSPTAAGSQSATITIESNDSNEGSLTVSVTGNGTIQPAPEIALSSTTVEIGEVNLGASSSGSFLIDNNGNADLIVSSISSDNGVFTVEPASGTITAGDTLHVTVTFSPNESGSQSATITIESNDSDESTLTVSVSGNCTTAQGPEIALSDTSVTICYTVVGTSDTGTFTITNEGSTDLVVSSIWSNDPMYLVDPTSATIAAGESQPVTVTFSPFSSGIQYGAITVSSNDTDESSLKVYCQARAYPPGWTTHHAVSGLASDKVRAVATDYKGTMWFGTWEEGLSRFDGVTWTTFTSEDGLANNTGSSIAIDSLSNLWLGSLTLDGGLSRYDGTSWTTYTTADGLASNFVESITTDSLGNIWFGTWGGGVSKFDGTNWTTYTTSDGLADNVVRAINIELDGTVWFATHNGVSKLDGSGWTTYTPEDGLASIYVYAIAIDSEGVKWFGTYEGVSKYDGSSWTTYTVEDGLAGNMVESIAIDSLDNLWFGTRNGLSKFDRTNWTTYNTTHGLADNFVFDIAIDHKDIIWIGTADGGISVLVPYGLAGEPEISLYYSLIDMGDVSAGSSGNSSFTITNTGSADLVISSISSDNGVFTLEPASATIAAGDTLHVTVTFSPTISGSQSAMITITSNDSDKDILTISVSGTGLPVPEFASSITFRDCPPDSSRVPDIEAQTITADVIDPDGIVKVYLEVYQGTISIGANNKLLLSESFDTTVVDSLILTTDEKTDSVRFTGTIPGMDLGAYVNYAIKIVDNRDSATYFPVMKYTVAPNRGKQDLDSGATNVADLMRCVYLVLGAEPPELMDYLGLDLDESGDFDTPDLIQLLSIWKGDTLALLAGVNGQNHSAKVSLGYEEINEANSNIEINLESSGNLNLGFFRIKYDTEKFIFGEAKAVGRISEGLTVVSYNNEEDGIYSIVVINLNGLPIISGSGTILNIPIATISDNIDGMGEISILDASFEKGVQTEISLETLSLNTVLPKAPSLRQNYPNPFNPTTTISYSIPENSEMPVTLNVYNIRGQLVRTLVNEVKSAGFYQVQWNGEDNRGRKITSGIYIYRIQAGDFVQTRKMVLLK
ncbi:MAG TPA: choice-of-anchor D domain-containing protein [archaeon]|nr:choice-of-anchor D domain-containing protein [archaeon]